MTKQPDLTVVPHPVALSRTLSIASLRERRRFTDRIVASPAECAALAKRYQIVAVNALEADVVVKPIGPDLIRFQAKIRAEIVQACGVSWAPIVQQIATDEEEILTTSADLLTSLEDSAMDDSAPTELVTGDQLDYGDIVAQIVALSIDPFPRDEQAADGSRIEYSGNPFAVLQTLKDKDRDDT